MTWKLPCITFSLYLIALAIAVTANAETIADEAKPVHRLPLTDPALAATSEQRQFLKYLIGCALPADVELYAEVNGRRFVFPGSLGLAPAWSERALTKTEQRWVSACILARTNYFGTPVQISLRARQSPHAALETSLGERQSHTLQEGGFFGNLFAEQPVAYVCANDRTPAERTELVHSKRICTVLSKTKTSTGATLTRCNFIHVGACGEVAHFTVDGEHYSEVIFTYLKPTTLSARLPARPVPTAPR